MTWLVNNKAVGRMLHLEEALKVDEVEIPELEKKECYWGLYNVLSCMYDIAWGACEGRRRLVFDGVDCMRIMKGGNRVLTCEEANLAADRIYKQIQDIAERKGCVEALEVFNRVLDRVYKIAQKYKPPYGEGVV